MPLWRRLGLRLRLRLWWGLGRWLGLRLQQLLRRPGLHLHLRLGRPLRLRLQQPLRLLRPRLWRRLAVRLWRLALRL